MPPRAKDMKHKEIENLSHPGDRKAPRKVAVGHVAGLHIQIQPSGAKSWLLRTRFGDWSERRDESGVVVERGRKKREIGLGPFPEVSLKIAKERALTVKEQIAQGIDPVQERKAAQAALVAAARRGLTFRAALDQFAEEKVKEFRSEKYRIQWKATIEKYAVPEIGAMLVQDIELQDVLRVLQPIWETRTETASKLRQRIEAILSWATVKGHRTGDNPARWAGNLKLVLPAPSKVSGSQNYPALQIRDAAQWWADLRAREGMGARALEFQAMTATRSGAIRFATWDEIDLDAKLWTIQPGRKSSKIPPSDAAKRIPLTDKMVELLRALPRLAGSDLVFWAPRGGPLSDATLGKSMRTIHEAAVKRGGKGYVDAASGEPAVPHGLRSTFRTWVAEQTNFDGDMAEVALFHKVGSKVAQAYNRADMIERRRVMMSSWCGFLAGSEPQKVVSMAEARA